VTGELTDDLSTHVAQPDVIARGGRRPGSGMLPLLVVLLLVAAAIVTQRRVGSAAGASFSGSVLAAPPHALVAQLSTSGGLAGQSPLTRIDPPQLAVYADGTAVRNASTMVRLRLAEVNELVSGLRAELAGYGTRMDLPGPARQVLDAPDVTVGVYDSGRMHTVTAYALGPDPSLGYPDRLVAAYKRFDRPLPPAVPGDRDDLREGVLTGPTAAALLAAWPVRRDGAGDGAAGLPAASFRLPDGHPVIARWRYLLPSEPRR
jgi:hypothetical protein